MAHRLGIAGKIWLSFAVFGAGVVFSVCVSQVASVRAEDRLRFSSEVLFPATQDGQRAGAAFERMAKGFRDAVVLEDSSALAQAERDGLAAAAALHAIGRREGLDPQRARTAAALGSKVAAFARDARAGYSPMTSATGATPEMAATSRRLGADIEALSQQIDAVDTQLAGDLSRELTEAVRASAWQRWISLLAFLAALGLSAVVVAYTIRRSIAEPIRAAVTDLTEASGRVASAATHVAISSQALSQGASEQAASLEETSASMEEMASMTRQTATNSQGAAAVMGEVDARVQISNRSLSDLVASMASIDESSRQVAKIIKTIDEIAFQTNILALNAAVEAARAGEAGMGFAVVAEEVRSLAQRSAQAARDTASLIDTSIQRARAGTEKVDQIATAIAAITESVVKVRGLVDEVSVASRQQTQGIGQVSQAVTEIEAVTQRTAATAEEGAEASAELQAQAERSMDVVRALEALVKGSDARADAGIAAHRTAGGASVLPMRLRSRTVVPPAAGGSLPDDPGTVDVVNRGRFR